MYLADRHRPVASRAPGSRRARGPVARTVILLGLVSLVTDISSESAQAVLPLYLTAGLGLSPLAYGLVDGTYSAASVVVRYLGGWLADRFDRPKPVALAGYSLSALARTVLLWTPGAGVVAAVLGVDRLGKGLRTAPRDVLIAASSDPASLGRSFGVHRALDTTGAMLGPLIAFVALWAVPEDYRLVFVISLAAAVIGVALLALLVPDLRPTRASATTATAATAAAAKATDAATTAGPDSTVAEQPRPTLRMLAQPGFARLVAAAALLGLLTLSDAFVYLVLQDRNDLAAQWFPLLFVGTNLAYLALAVPFGRVADWLGRGRVMVLGHAFLVGAYVCASGPTGSLVVGAGCLLLLGAFYASTDGVLAAAASSVVRPQVRGSAIATAQSAVALSRLGAALVFGAAWTLVGPGRAVLLMAALLAVAVPAAWLVLRPAMLTGATR
ncbi:Sugar phosphate permease [Pedococcus dokdonensis]|uniref:Sugar phosphate permease n=1 Tax=Pedococcus dokdonensis TaxID=443156 RepID=A0A1H0V6G3_9MICO|nr:MFS transporter [Pedococcus dokdonensis]SDP73951.1 Sugar phosphate permease [Pedococcus dokdonensis]